MTNIEGEVIRFKARCHNIGVHGRNGPYSLKAGIKFDLPAGFELKGVPAFYIAAIDECAKEISPKESGVATIRVIVGTETPRGKFAVGSPFQITFGGQFILADCVVISELEEVSV